MADSITRVLEAAAFAASKHCQQRRKDVGASPYINHPLEVARVLSSEGGVDDTALLMAALLHDTVEDTKTSFEELVDAFGDEVAGLVREVTDDKSLPKQRRKELQIELAANKSPRAKQLKLADKISNVRDIDADSPSGWSTQRRLEYLDWAQRVIAGCRGVNSRLDQAFDDTLEAARSRVGPAE